MKKILTSVGLVFAVSILTVCAAFAEETETAQWSPNNPNIAIYENQDETDVYSVIYNNADTELVNKADGVRLLMIDGGFVPDTKIIIENNRTLVPISLVSETLDAKVDWNEHDRLVTVNYDEIEIRLTIGNEMAVVNGNEVLLDSPAAIHDSLTYVPLRFITESFGMSVDFIPHLNYGNTWTAGEKKYSELTYAETRLYNRNQVSLVMIESNREAGKIISVDDGLAIVKEASKQEYESILENLKTNGSADINESYDGDYDSQAITYTGLDIGRYYVYELEKYEAYPVFFNKYTGEIFCESVGQPFVGWDEGFINISWLYQ